MVSYRELTGAMRITRSEIIPTVAKICVKIIASPKLEVYLLVNKLVSIVNLIIFTRALSLKMPSVSFRRFASCSYPDQSQQWTIREGVVLYVINHRRSDKDVSRGVPNQPDLNQSAVSRINGKLVSISSILWQ